MDFGPIISQLIGLGLPILGTALGGPLGGAVAGVIAKTIGAASATPEAIKQKLDGMPPEVAIQQLKSAENEWVATVQAESQVGQKQLEEVGSTMRAELDLAGVVGGRAGAIIGFMQASWRPIFAYETIAEMAAGACVLTFLIATGNDKSVETILKLVPFLQFYMPMKMAVLGVYSYGRTREKEAAVTANPVGRVVEVVKGVLTKH